MLPIHRSVGPVRGQADALIHTGGLVIPGTGLERDVPLESMAWDKPQACPYLV